jgi:predicted NBD/HSP70 family sugar kinase/mannose-6-phosphate isomerase class I
MSSIKRILAGIDVGGSHMSFAMVDTLSGAIVNECVKEIKMDAGGSIAVLLGAWEALFDNLFTLENRGELSGVGVAMPGPFDYRNGIAQLAGVRKFDSIFGLNLKQSLLQISEGRVRDVVFENDATCFALGEYYAGAAQGSARSLVTTLGTGFGSTFLVGDRAQTEAGEAIPPDGYLYNIPFAASIADDYFSTRWFVSRWKERTGGGIISGVQEMAALAGQGDAFALSIFEEFTGNLSDFIFPWLKKFNPDVWVIGGNIAKASSLFIEPLKNKLRKLGFYGSLIAPCVLWEKAPIIGAAIHADKTVRCKEEKHYRKTTQFLAPPKAVSTEQGHYDIYPAFPLGSGKIYEGSSALAAWIAQQQTVVIDGYEGVLWNQLVDDLSAAPALQGKKVRWFHTSAAMKSPVEIAQMITPFMGAPDSIFGKITGATLSDWFYADKLRQMQPDAAADINVLVGCGAALAGWNAPLAYVDLPKNELQFRMRAGVVTNLGAHAVADDREMYKRAFFIDWPVLNEHKRALLPAIDLIVDGQRPDHYLMMSGDNLRAGLATMSRNFFRVRPWFEPGVWGGTWMKEHIDGLNAEAPNLAWSFELMTLENGLMFESDGYRLEVSFDFLMFHAHKAVLGDCAERFRYDFPIRFDFLDTFDGGNLSVQCHPRPAYIQKEFGMPFTQDETYYILDCRPGSSVYLGFQEGIHPAAFHRALVESERDATEIEVTRYVQKLPAKKHDFFLIPNGTIHASGKDNLVLEISSAPYIFTFKMYDWVRLDIDGRPRPLNVEHGMKNVYFERRGEAVKEELISKPHILSEDSACRITHLPTHPHQFYDVHRYTLKTEVKVETGGKCHVWMLVEGASVWLETAQGMRQRFNYAETFVIPAAAGSYKLINESDKPALLVKTFVK